MEVKPTLQKDDKWVVTIAVLLALIIVSYFAVQKFWLSGESIQASSNDSSSAKGRDAGEPDGENGKNGTSAKNHHSLWEEVKGQDEVHVWLFGDDKEADNIASLLEENWPAEAKANVHNESHSQHSLMDILFNTAEAEPLPENSFVLLQLPEWTDSDLTTLESIIRRLLSEQPQLAIAVISDEIGENESIVSALTRAYKLSWIEANEIPAQLSEIGLARLSKKPLHDGVAAAEVEKIDSTDLFYGNVEWRPLSSTDSPFMFDQYYALIDSGSQVDYELAGNQVGIVYLTDSNGGVGTVELDGYAVAEIDCYTEELSQQVMWIPLSEEGKQTLSIKYGGDNDDNATGNQVFVSGLIVLKE